MTPRPVPKKPAKLLERRWVAPLTQRLLVGPHEWWHAYIDWSDIAAASGPLPPDVQSPAAKGVFTDWRERKRFYRFRRRLFLRVPFSALLYSDTFAVAPQEWPKEVAALFPTDSPPTPYEVMCRILEDQRAFGLEKLLTYRERSIFMLWLAGIPAGLLDQIESNAMLMVQEAVRKMLKGDFFFVWSLGDDLIPIRISPRQDAWLRWALELPGRPILNKELWTHERKTLLESPYVKGILLSRTPRRPMERRGPTFRGVFRNLDEKAATIIASPETAAWFFQQRIRMLALKYRPEWATYTDYLEEAYVQANSAAPGPSGGDSLAKVALRLASGGKDPKPRRRNRRNGANDQGVRGRGHPSGAVEGDSAVDGAAVHGGLGQESGGGDSGEPDHAADRA